MHLFLIIYIHVLKKTTKLQTNFSYWCKTLKTGFRFPQLVWLLCFVLSSSQSIVINRFLEFLAWYVKSFSSAHWFEGKHLLTENSKYFSTRSLPVIFCDVTVTRHRVRFLNFLPKQVPLLVLNSGWVRSFSFRYFQPQSKKTSMLIYRAIIGTRHLFFNNKNLFGTEKSILNKNNIWTHFLLKSGRCPTFKSENLYRIPLLKENLYI